MNNRDNKEILLAYKYIFGNPVLQNQYQEKLGGGRGFQKHLTSYFNH